MRHFSNICKHLRQSGALFTMVEDEDHEEP